MPEPIPGLSPESGLVVTGDPPDPPARPRRRRGLVVAGLAAALAVVLAAGGAVWAFDPFSLFGVRAATARLRA